VLRMEGTGVGLRRKTHTGQDTLTLNCPGRHSVAPSRPGIRNEIVWLELSRVLGETGTFWENGM
jgi:hypothetical protein